MLDIYIYILTTYEKNSRLDQDSNPGLQIGPVDRLGALVVMAPAQITGDPGSNPGPGK